MIQLALTAYVYEDHLPSSRLVLPSAMTWTARSACVAKLPHSHKETRARFLLLLLYGVAVLRLVMPRLLPLPRPVLSRHL